MSIKFISQISFSTVGVPVRPTLFACGVSFNLTEKLFLYNTPPCLSPSPRWCQAIWSAVYMVGHICFIWKCMQISCRWCKIL